jgi:transcriptional regulator with XRE-family HTH domain
MTSVSRSDMRRRAGLTQLQLARLAGSSAPQICVWERGERALPSETVTRIALVLFDRLKGAPIFDSPDDLARALGHGNGQ